MLKIVTSRIIPKHLNICLEKMWQEATLRISHMLSEGKLKDGSKQFICKGNWNSVSI